MGASSFEDAATAVLRGMLACAEPSLAQVPGAPPGRLLRGVVHLRPEGSYQRLFGIEHPGGARVEGTGYLTSAHVWRWIVEHARSISIDVQLRSFRPFLLDGEMQWTEPEDSALLPGHDTRERMLGRDATHVHVVPLRAPGGGVLGMVTLEARHGAATGAQNVWADCAEQLELLANIALPYLSALPVRRVEPARADELMPVVGSTTAALFELVRVFAQQEETVLVNGPTGVGKSRLARWCHEQSQRKGQPFETLDLLGVPEDLQTAELFGWKRGAFTGAIKDTPGAIARAAKGTLFIDEVDKLSLKAQASLLRVIEERRYRPLGDDGSERRAEARFIVGTNADLRAAVRTGRFREDLYYRINVLPVRLPPLAERLDELPQWAEFMLARRHKEASGAGAARIAPEAVKLLASTPWPGNLRQLDNIVRRAYTLAIADWSGTGGQRLIELRHVERALAYEGGAEARPLVSEFWHVARAFVREAEQRRNRGAPLSLDLAEALRGMVLGLAVQRCASREEAFTLLGQEHLLKNRNHHRALRRELERVRELLRVVGGEISGDLSAVLAAVEAPASGEQ